MPVYHALPPDHPDHHRAAALEHRITEAVQRGRKVWEPDSRQAFEVFADMQAKEMHHVVHIQFALQIATAPPTAFVAARSYDTRPESLWDLFEAGWVQARVNHDEDNGGIIWRARPAVEVADIPDAMQLWSLFFRIGFVPRRFDVRLADHDEAQHLKEQWALEREGALA